MQRALVETGILYGAFSRRDRYHETEPAFVRDADSRTLPELVVLAETMNALTQTRRNRRGRLDARGEPLLHGRTDDEPGMSARSNYERRAQLSSVDSPLVASAPENGIEHVYSFDTGFDSVDGLERLNANTNPYEPE